MSRIRSKNTSPEILIRKFLFSHGYRFRLHNKSLPGTPDITLKKHNTVIFINGCFWHMHKRCKYFQLPSSNKDYWIPKLLRNIERDKVTITALKKMKIKVIVIWECQLKTAKIEKTLDKLLKRLAS